MHEHVGLPLHLDELLPVHLRERPLVHGLGLAGVHAGQAVRRPHVLEDLVLQRRSAATASPRRIASIDAWSCTRHSHSRFCRKS